MKRENYLRQLRIVHTCVRVCVCMFEGPARRRDLWAESKFYL